MRAGDFGCGQGERMVGFRRPYDLGVHHGDSATSATFTSFRLRVAEGVGAGVWAHSVTDSPTMTS